jgi:hypothetical protein
MSRTQQQQQPMRPLMIMHVLLIVLVLGWWAMYFWAHTPARRVYRLATVAGNTSGGFINFDPLFAAFRVAIGDVALGLGTVTFFALGSRVYARRVQVWLDARTSGHAVSLGATDLESQALQANVNRTMAP